MLLPHLLVALTISQSTFTKISGSHPSRDKMVSLAESLVLKSSLSFLLSFSSPSNSR
jgi:hypothetical protein